jgi:16S rRNA (guanine1516-N2)-methyltransferase
VNTAAAFTSSSPVGLRIEPGGEARAELLLTHYALTTAGAPAGLQIVSTAEGLQLHDAADPSRKPLRLDYPPAMLRVTRREPLARALGRTARTVLDATAGLGGDALRLAGLGMTVTACERCPAIAALLDDALTRWRAGAGPLAEMAGRITLVHADAREWLARLSRIPDAIYIDPMFPPKRRKSAAVRKELHWLRALAGDDPDAGELLRAALAVAGERVIVKRPDEAPPLQPNPTVSYAGKLVRYDVYRTHLKRTPRP